MDETSQRKRMKTTGVSGASLLAYDQSVLDNASAAVEVVTFEQIAGILPSLISETTLANQQAAYIAYSTHAGSVMPVQSLGQPPYGEMQGGKGCQVCVKTGYLHGDDVFVSKVAAGGAVGYGNTGLLLVSSQKSLAPQYILQDNAILTEIRTAAATALASRYFLPSQVKRIGILGGSIQAIWQLRFLTLITDCREVLVKTRSKASAESFKVKMSHNDFDKQWNIHVADSMEEFKTCQLIHTITTSREPILKAEHLDWSQGVHISAVGADCPGKRELDDSISAAMEMFVTDSRVQSQERGEGQYLCKERQEQIVEIGELLSREGHSELPHRGSGTLTVFDSSGIALQDVCIAKAVIKILHGARV